MKIKDCTKEGKKISFSRTVHPAPCRKKDNSKGKPKGGLRIDTIVFRLGRGVLSEHLYGNLLS